MMSCSARDLLCLPSKHLATSQDRIKYFSDELPRVLEHTSKISFDGHGMYISYASRNQLL